MDKEENTKREKQVLGVLQAELWACLMGECFCLHEASCLILLAQLQPLPLIYAHWASHPAGQKLIFREKMPERSQSVCSIAGNIQRQEAALITKINKTKAKSDFFGSQFVVQFSDTKLHKATQMSDNLLQI